MFKAPRGTKDIQPTDQKYWRYVEQTAIDLGQQYGFRRLDTPVFEDSALFVRTVGESTDIVEKETYSFQDRGADSLTLRPEGTAPVCRAYLENGMQSLPQPVRLYYFCPVFRYDRPQAGRYRQHHQFGVEVIGDPDPLVDAEVVQIGWHLMGRLGLKNLSLVLNSIGDSKCRPDYIDSLRSYYSNNLRHLCPDCRNRLERNPLRLLDCKKESCKPLQDGAPASVDGLCQQCREHWDRFLFYLSVMEIPYRIDHRLVRGLDYYTRTVFEITPPREGSQSTLLGGGRYDGLIEQLGGRSTPGVGFATGLERLILNVRRQEVEVPNEKEPEYFIVTLGEQCVEASVKLASLMRERGVGVTQGPSGRSLRGQMRTANSLAVPKVIIIGDEELANDALTLRDMASKQQETLTTKELLERL